MYWICDAIFVCHYDRELMVMIDWTQLWMEAPWFSHSVGSDHLQRPRAKRVNKVFYITIHCGVNLRGLILVLHFIMFKIINLHVAPNQTFSNISAKMTTAQVSWIIQHPCYIMYMYQTIKELWLFSASFSILHFYYNLFIDDFAWIF